MSKKNLGAKALEKLTQLLTGIQERTMWLSRAVRENAARIDSTQDRVRLNRGEYDEFVEKADKAVLELQRAHNRLRFEFDQNLFGQQRRVGPYEVSKDAYDLFVKATNDSLMAIIASVAAVKNQVDNAQQLHATLRNDFNVHRADAEGLIDSAAASAGKVAGEKFMELTKTLRDEVDRLRILSAGRADRSVAEFNKLYDQVQSALQKFNERVSGLESTDQAFQNGVNRHNKVLIEGLQQRVLALESDKKFAESRVESLVCAHQLIKDLFERVEQLEGFRRSYIEMARFFAIPQSVPVQVWEQTKMVPAGEPGGNCGQPGAFVTGMSVKNDNVYDDGHKTYSSHDPLKTSSVTTRGVSHS